MLVVFVCLLVGPKILLLFPIWLMGVWVYFVVNRCTISIRVGWVLVLSSIVAYFVFRLGGYPDALLKWTIEVLGKSFVEDRLKWSKYFLSSYVVGIIITVHFIGIATISRQLESLLTYFERPIRFLAGFTFALYLFHYPCLQFFAAVFSSVLDLKLRTGLVLGGTIVVIWILGMVTERRKGDVRRWVLLIGDIIFQKITARKPE